MGLFSSSFPFEWEYVDECHERAKVRGGWIVKSVRSVFHYPGLNGRNTGYDWRESLCFVPDRWHSWKIAKKDAKKKGR